MLSSAMGPMESNPGRGWDIIIEVVIDRIGVKLRLCCAVSRFLVSCLSDVV